MKDIKEAAFAYRELSEEVQVMLICWKASNLEKYRNCLHGPTSIIIKAFCLNHEIQEKQANYANFR